MVTAHLPRAARTEVSPTATAFSVKIRHASSTAAGPPIDSLIARSRMTQLDSVEYIKKVTPKSDQWTSRLRKV